MKNFIHTYRKWSSIYESEEYDAQEQIDDLKNLVRLGLIDESELLALLRKKGRSEIIENYPAIQEILNSPEYRELQEKGLTLVSSKTQLLNGSILFGRPGYRPKDRYAIGIFPGPMLIRRIMPKGIPLGVWGRRLGSMDFPIKELNFIPQHKFYGVAMRWILDHIDLENPQFPVKTKTRKGYFDK